MADFKLTARPTLGGAHATHANCTARETRDLTIASLAAHRSDADLKALSSAFVQAFETALPETGKRVQAGPIVFSWAGHQQWFANAPILKIADLSATLNTQLGEHAIVTDQSGAWTEIQLRGDASRDVLERLCPLDLHPSVFQVGTCARTVMEHLGVQIALIDDEPTFTLLTPSSSAASFWNALEHALSSACGPAI